MAVQAASPRIADYLDKEHLLTAEKVGCIPARADDSYPDMRDVLGSHLYRVYKAKAIRERSSLIAVIRDVLRKNCEEAG